MAVFKKPVPAVAAKPVAKPMATKPVAKPAIPKAEGYQVVDMSTIELQPKAGGGGGKTLSAFAVKVFSLENGQGFKITEEKYGENGKGLASLYAGAARRNIVLRVRRDVNNQLWLFRVSAEDEQTRLEAKAKRAEERAEQVAE